MSSSGLLQKLKKLLNITNDEKDFVLEFTIDKISDMILNYCNIKYIPIQLENVLLSMCADSYRIEQPGKEKSEGNVKSITEGDVSVSFGSTENIQDNISAKLIKDYKTQLNRFRKADW